MFCFIVQQKKGMLMLRGRNKCFRDLQNLVDSLGLQRTKPENFTKKKKKFSRVATQNSPSLSNFSSMILETNKNDYVFGFINGKHPNNETKILINTKTPFLFGWFTSWDFLSYLNQKTNLIRISTDFILIWRELNTTNIDLKLAVVEIKIHPLGSFKISWC